MLNANDKKNKINTFINISLYFVIYRLKNSFRYIRIYMYDNNYVMILDTFGLIIITLNITLRLLHVI